MTLLNSGQAPVQIGFPCFLFKSNTMQWNLPKKLQINTSGMTSNLLSFSYKLHPVIATGKHRSILLIIS